MSAPQVDRVGYRWLSPYPLFLGILSSFLACCGWGRVVSQQNSLGEFKRFHLPTSPETFFFPTAHQTLSLAMSQLQPGQIAVVVSGSSVLRGVGQRESELWTVHLQSILGPKYRVFNFANNGAAPQEVGTICAEMLRIRNVPVILVVPHSPAMPWNLDLDGAAYRYFFWDARAKNLLGSDTKREAKLEELMSARMEDEKFQELRRQMEIDRWTHSRDLWTSLAYTNFSTVWSAQLKPFWSPRSRFPDVESSVGVPFELRYSPSTEEFCLQVLRGWIAYARAQGMLHPEGFRSGYPLLEAEVKQALPQVVQSATLHLVISESPYYVSKLLPQEQADYRTANRERTHALQAMGFLARNVGHNWSTDDYFDRCHISETGGRKLAAEAAPAIQDLAHRLGYLEGE